MKQKILLVYMPVIHAGYTALIDRLKPDVLLVVSDEIANKYDKRRKDIRALSSKDIVSLALTLYPRLIVMEFKEKFRLEGIIHMPREDISEDIFRDYLSEREVVWESVFLRYDSKKSLAPQEIVPDRVVSCEDPVVAAILSRLYEASKRSPDWWRQVAAAVVKKGEVLSLCINEHAPSNHITYSLGDPRSNAQKGQNANISKSAHAEPRACFLAGPEGTKGADLWVSTFPCPVCANFLHYTGIKSLYFVEGYALVDGAEDLRSAGIEIVKVET